MQVFLTGASGLIGQAIAAALVGRGDRVLGLSRAGRVPAGVEPVAGDVTRAGAWAERVAGCDAVIHLAGEPVAGKRWSEAQKQRILDSRVQGTRALVAALAAAPAAGRPRVFLCANGADYYPFDESDREYGEDAPPGDSVLARVCVAWQREAEASPARVVIYRTGVVLVPGGGALARLAPLFRAYLGGPIGSGRQWFSFVHLADVVAAFLAGLDEERLAGPVNLVAPEGVRQKDFARVLGAALHRPSWLPVPGPALRLAVGELAEYLLHGRRVVPRALERAGFAFRHPTARGAVS